MGNKSSRPKRDKSAVPSFSRTDTQGSTRSGLSARSGRSRRSSALAAVDSSIRSLHSRPASTSNSPAIIDEDGADGFPFASVPRSLQVHEPKESILISSNSRKSMDGANTEAVESTQAQPQAQTSHPAPGKDVSSNQAQPQPQQQQSQIDPQAKHNPYAVAQTASSQPSDKQPLSSTSDVPVQKLTPDTANGVASAATAIPGAAGGPRGVGMAGSAGDRPVLSPSNLSFQRELPFGTSPQTPGHTPHIIGGPQGVINIDETIQLLLDAGYSGKTTRRFCLKGSEVAAICAAARNIFLEQPALLELQPPVKIVGDTHGQYGDLLRLFNMCGFPPEANYLFLGDYVDRGKQSLETIVLLLCYKIKYPGNFFILRGNHECAGITRIYGFYDECKRRASVKTWKTFVDTFNTLPIAAVVAGKIFCVHGGLSPSLGSINDIRGIERPTDVPDYGLLNDLLWSDPTDGPNEWEDNERGVSYCYNKVAINKFIQRFGYDLVCRAHMVVEDGYEFFNERSLVTVFSAPNYCGEFDNWGAIMSVSEDLLCSFELLKPLDSVALKEEMKRGKHERRQSLAQA